MPALLCSHVEAGAGRRAVVFLHGVGHDGETFRGQLIALSPVARAVAWNMPGYAGSALGEPLTMADVAAALERLLDRLAIPRAVLVGHSLGGMVALEAWARLPSRIAGLALIGTTPMFGSRDGSFERAFLARLFAPLEAGRTMAQLAPEVARASLPHGVDPAALATLTRAFAAVPEPAYRASARVMLGFDRRAALPTITVPTLLIAGDQDRDAPLKTMRRMAEAIPGARIEVMAGAGHCPHLERPTEVGALVAGLVMRAFA